MSARSLTFALLSTALFSGVAAVSSASAAANHPPGPDRCWARHHQQWVWVCPAREQRPQRLFFEPSETGSAFRDPGYPDRNFSDPGYYDPGYYNTIPLFFFDLPSR